MEIGHHLRYETQMQNADSLKLDVEVERRRIANEAQSIAEARLSVMRDGTIPLSDMRRWADSIGTEQELPLPLPRKP